MTALVAGFLLVAYLLATGAIYRLAFSFSISSKRFERSRTEEITFSVLVTIGPFLATWLLLYLTPAGSFPVVPGPLQKVQSYRIVLEALVNDNTQKALIPATLTTAAYIHAVREQGRFVLWLWAFCLIEGLFAGRLVRGYGNYPVTSWRRKFCDRFLLKYVSEWQVLFTTLPLPSTDPRTSVEIDALSGNILYRGKLVNWFTDSDGKLAGIFLENAMRYQQELLNRDRDEHRARELESYWRAIPGSKLYLNASSIDNYNIRYVEPSNAGAPISAIEHIVEQELSAGMTVTALPARPDPPEQPQETRDAYRAK